jgi:RHS repeat-associated protein
MCRVNTARDPLGRVTAVDVTLNNQQIYLSTSRSHRADGLLKAQTLSNGLAEARTYDLQGRLTQWQVGSETRSLSYDLNGNLTQWQAPTVTGNYTYDFLDRLTVDKRTLGGTLNTLTLAYNPNGNRVYSIDNGVVNYYTTPGYPNANNRVTLVGTTTIAYDAAGNTTAHGSYTYAYNLRGLLTNIYAAGTQRAGYRYNHQHQRTQKLADTTTVYHYDLAGNLILETTDASQPKVAYVYADSTPLAQVSRTATETLYYLHTDHEGTPRVATDSNQAVVWRWEGKAFGDTAPTGTATINLRYAGQYYDAESGLFYNWRRYYDPKLGRYLTSDPLGLFAGPNTYAYVSNNPLRWTDPTGLAYFCMYSQSSGKFDCFDKTTDKHTIGATCYSGSGASRDKPADQCVKDKGPIPGGWWNIGSGYNHPELGNPTFNLDPQTGTDTCLRDLFRIHADNSLGNFSASGGCIVCSKQVRDQLKNGGGGDLWVTK